MLQGGGRREGKAGVGCWTHGRMSCWHNNPTGRTAGGYRGVLGGWGGEGCRRVGGEGVCWTHGKMNCWHNSPTSRTAGGCLCEGKGTAETQAGPLMGGLGASIAAGGGSASIALVLSSLHAMYLRAVVTSCVLHI
jgi:hypothetical protein